MVAAGPGRRPTALAGAGSAATAAALAATLGLAAVCWVVSVWQMTGPEPAGGCCFSGHGCDGSGVWAEAIAGTANRAKMAKIREITAYKPVRRWLNNP